MLIIVDPQNDFLEGGALAVNGSKKSIKNIMQWMDKNLIKNEFVVCTQDWHPEDHCSFSEWPEHCIKGTFGAAIYFELARYLIINDINVIIARKGSDIDHDEYSFLASTEHKKQYYNIIDKADRIVVTGIVGSVCVKNTIKDIIDIIKEQNGDTKKIIVPIDCIAHFDDNAKDEFISWCNENNVTVC